MSPVPVDWGQRAFFIAEDSVKYFTVIVHQTKLRWEEGRSGMGMDTAETSQYAQQSAKAMVGRVRKIILICTKESLSSVLGSTLKQVT